MPEPKLSAPLRERAIDEVRVWWERQNPNQAAALLDVRIRAEAEKKFDAAVTSALRFRAVVTDSVRAASAQCSRARIPNTRAQTETLQRELTEDAVSKTRQMFSEYGLSNQTASAILEELQLL